MCSEPEFESDVSDLGEVRTLVHTDTDTSHGDRMGRLDGFEGLTDHFEVVAVGTLDDHRDWDSFGLGQKTAEPLSPLSLTQGTLQLPCRSVRPDE